MTMSTDEIKDYLSDNTDLPESALDDLAHDIEERLDYTHMYEQIDELLKQFTYWDDYDRTLKN